MIKKIANKVRRLSKKQLALTLLMPVLLIIGYIAYMETSSENSIKTFFTTANLENCQSIYPLSNMAVTNEVLCPRGDVGNFMVIDKVSYEINNIAGAKFSPKKQVLVTTCITARGNAAWNEGEYKDCTNDPKIFTFKWGGIRWAPDNSSVTNLSALLNEAGAKPDNFATWSEQCWELRRTELIYVGKSSISCTGYVESEINYAIQHHSLTRQGYAH